MNILYPPVKFQVNRTLFVVSIGQFPWLLCTKPRTEGAHNFLSAYAVFSPTLSVWFLYMGDQEMNEKEEAINVPPILLFFLIWKNQIKLTVLKASGSKLFSNWQGMTGWSWTLDQLSWSSFDFGSTMMDSRIGGLNHWFD